MRLNWKSLIDAFHRVAPEGSAASKMALVLGIVLLFEGISVLLLFSYDAIYLGLISIAVGALLAFLAYPRGAPERPATEAEEREQPADPLGMRLIESLVYKIGGDNVLIALGFAVIVVTLAFNYFVSARPDIGDLDTLLIMFGGVMVAYPFLAEKFRVEAAFSFMFLGIVVVLLVIPQAVMSIHSGVGTSAGNWYVHYMLAAPFSGILNVLGIPATSTANSVTITFSDGFDRTLGISAYCAGLYSFSIFVSAFMSFVLVFERMQPKRMVWVLAFGLLIAYLGNLFRMVIIGVVGYSYGMDALLWAHRNVGWILFLSWSTIFWYLVIRYTSSHPEGTQKMQNHT